MFDSAPMHMPAQRPSGRRHLVPHSAGRPACISTEEIQVFGSNVVFCLERDIIGLTGCARRAADCRLQGAGILGKRSVSETFDEGRVQSRSNVGSRIMPQRSSNSSALRRPTAPKRKDYGISRHVLQVSKHGNSSLNLVTHWYARAVRLCARAYACID